MLKRYTLLIAILLMALLPGRADSPATTAAKPDSLTVSIITCFPGPDIYALCGHTAIRVRSERMDSVWNYGLFDFSQDDFIYRFVKGETDYTLGGYPFQWFMPEYVRRGSKVVEQDLNLSQQEARKLLRMLNKESLPQNRTYRYNYVRDNCATRPLVRLDSAVNMPIIYPDTTRFGTYRREMRHFHANYPWYQFGIDLVLGSGLDNEITPREEMFAPVVLMENLSKATFSDGRPVVSGTRELNTGTTEAVLPPTPIWKTPLVWGWLLFLIATVFAFVDIRRGRTSTMLYSLYWLAVGMAGVVVWFLIFFSTHEATSPNLQMWWLNPLMLVAAVTVWIRRCALVTDILAWIGGISATILLLLWPFQPQSGNPAVFPLMATGAILGAAYAINYSKNSYKRKGTARAVTRKPSQRRKGSKARGGN